MHLNNPIFRINRAYAPKSSTLTEADKDKQEIKIMAESNLTWALIQMPEDIDAGEWIEAAAGFGMTITTKDGKTEVLTLSPHTMYYDSEDKMYHSFNKWVKVNGSIYS